ncbi:contact-dependent growth inhibition system immunity protein [Streptomyces avermitilis]|uniref:contact-dependent growth inhibition system immunity protein n=1 Tax=Streptomyces avermitilis TaxID=33903 RepID=UPI0038272155
MTHFLGTYFYQGSFQIEYGSHAEAVEDYLAGEPHEDLKKTASEIGEFLTLNPSDAELAEAATVLGLRETRPEGVSLGQRLTDIQGIITHHLRT